MDFNEYQSRASRTAVYPEGRAVEYTAIGLGGEAGELLNKVKKSIRGDYDNADKAGTMRWEKFREDCKGELGDILWYLSENARVLGYTLEEIAISNIEKVTDRANRNMTKGNGDNR